MPGSSRQGRRVSSRVVVLIGLGWLITATAVGAAGLMSAVRPSALPLLLLGLTTAVLAAAWRLPAFRGWLATIDERWLVGLHLTRFVGAYFLPCRSSESTSGGASSSK